MAQLRLCNVETLLQSRTACAAPPAQAFRVASVDRLHTICAASPAQENVREGIYPLRKQPSNQLPTSCADSPAQPRFAAANAPSASAAAHRISPWHNSASAMSRRFSSLVPLAQPHPRKPSGLRQSIDSTPFAQPYPRKLSGLSRSLDFTPFAQLHLRNLGSLQRTRLPRPPQRIAVSRIPRQRPFFGLGPLAQPHPRKPLVSAVFQSNAGASCGPLPFALVHPRNKQSARARSAAKSKTPAGGRRYKNPPLITECLIANLELEFELTHTKISPLEISLVRHGD